MLIALTRALSSGKVTRSAAACAPSRIIFWCQESCSTTAGLEAMQQKRRHVSRISRLVSLSIFRRFLLFSWHARTGNAWRGRAISLLQGNTLKTLAAFARFASRTDQSKSANTAGGRRKWRRYFNLRSFVHRNDWCASCGVVLRDGRNHALRLCIVDVVL